VKLQVWSHRVTKFPTHSVLKVNVTTRSQCTVEGFLCCSKELKKEDIVKCVSTFQFRVFKSGDLGGHAAVLLHLHDGYRYCSSTSSVAMPSCTDNIKTSLLMPNCENYAFSSCSCRGLKHAKSGSVWRTSSINRVFFFKDHKNSTRLTIPGW
jgi:hypothetical protein